jgi:hypothetical protein
MIKYYVTRISNSNDVLPELCILEHRNMDKASLFVTNLHRGTRDRGMLTET